MLGLLIRLAIGAAGLWIASRLVPGMSIEGTGTLVLAAFLLGLVNAIVRPLAIVLTFPITIVTLGLFLLVVNAGMLALVAALLDGFQLALSRPYTTLPEKKEPGSGGLLSITVNPWTCKGCMECV